MLEQIPSHWTLLHQWTAREARMECRRYGNDIRNFVAAKYGCSREDCKMASYLIKGGAGKYAFLFEDRHWYIWMVDFNQTFIKFYLLLQEEDAKLF